MAHSNRGRSGLARFSCVRPSPSGSRALRESSSALGGTRDPQKVAGAYTVDTVWRNRDEHLTGREEVEAFLTQKWDRELDYRRSSRATYG